MKDPKCPPGYRFVVQLIDCNTLEEAELTAWQMFGIHKADRAVFVPGVSRPATYRDFPRHPARPKGFRLYVPVGFRIGYFKQVMM